MKKKIILIICLILLLAIGLFVLTGCGNKKEENKVTNNTLCLNTTTISDAGKPAYCLKTPSSAWRSSQTKWGT